MSGSATESIPEYSMEKQDALFSDILMLTDLFSAKILFGKMLLNLVENPRFLCFYRKQLYFLLFSHLSLVHLLW